MPAIESQGLRGMFGPGTAARSFTSMDAIVDLMAEIVPPDLKQQKAAA